MGSLIGKNIVITGANTGLGKETSRVLAKMGANVIMACRNMEKGGEAKAEIEERVPNAQLTLLKLDLSSLDSIESFVNAFNEMSLPLHILINNAGVMAIPYQETVNKFEMQFGTNHLGHFHLTTLLIPKLKEAQPSRVVCLSSTAHKMEGIRWNDLSGKGTWYKGMTGRWNAYGQSKTANLLFAVELNRRMHLEGLKITANAVHPGVIKTELGRDLGGFEKAMMTLGSPLMKTIPQGAATSIYVATAPELEGIGGKFFENCNEAVAKAWATNPSYAKRLWEMSEQMIQAAYRPDPNAPEPENNDGPADQASGKDEQPAPVAEPKDHHHEDKPDHSEPSADESVDLIDTTEE